MSTHSLSNLMCTLGLKLGNLGLVPKGEYGSKIEYAENLDRDGAKRLRGLTLQTSVRTAGRQVRFVHADGFAAIFHIGIAGNYKKLISQN